MYMRLLNSVLYVLYVNQLLVELICALVTIHCALCTGQCALVTTQCVMCSVHGSAVISSSCSSTEGCSVPGSGANLRVLSVVTGGGSSAAGTAPGSSIVASGIQSVQTSQALCPAHARGWLESAGLSV